MVKNKNNFEVIFFDIGGVLLHIHPDRMIKEIAIITNNSFNVVQNNFPESAHDAYERGKINDHEWFNLFKKSLPDSGGLSEKNFWKAWSMLLGEETDVIDILIKLKKSYRIWLLSNTNPSHIKNEIENNNIFPQLVDGTVYSFDVGYRKPEKDIYKVASDLAEVDLKRCVFIDDLEDNIIGANNIGMQGIHYKNTPDLKNDLKSLNILQ